MPSATGPELKLDDIDDLIYFTRANESNDLKTTISELSQKHNCKEGDIIAGTIDPDSGNTLLHYASANGLLDILKHFLSQLDIQLQPLPSSESSEDWSSFNPTLAPDTHLINRQNGQGNTPLQWAAYNGHVEVVKALVAAGANMWIKNSAGHLALFEAERADRTEVVGFLLLAGGREVERKGTQGVASSEDVADLGEASGSGAAGSVDGDANAGADVTMGDARPS